MDVSSISRNYRVRSLGLKDVPEVYSLCRSNELYYSFCPPFVTEESIIKDMRALPPRKELKDKFYIGFYDDSGLAAVMDLIIAFPNDRTAFIGFFMVDAGRSNKGVGSGIIKELDEFLSNNGFEFIRLGWVKGNPQAEHFWHKNGFKETGVTYDTDGYTVIVAEKEINPIF